MGVRPPPTPSPPQSRTKLTHWPWLVSYNNCLDILFWCIGPNPTSQPHSPIGLVPCYIIVFQFFFSYTDPTPTPLPHKPTKLDFEGSVKQSMIFIVFSMVFTTAVELAFRRELMLKAQSTKAWYLLCLTPEDAEQCGHSRVVATVCLMR